MSCLPQEEDGVVYDELVHNSVAMGLRLGRNKRVSSSSSSSSSRNNSSSDSSSSTSSTASTSSSSSSNISCNIIMW